MIFNIFFIFNQLVAMVTSQIMQLHKFYMVDRELLSNHYCKNWVKYLHRDSNKCKFSFFLPYTSLENLSGYSNQNPKAILTEKI